MRRKHGSNFNLVQVRRIVELYSSTGDKGCMMSDCERFKNQNLVVNDFVNENLSPDSSDSERENLEVNFFRWSKDDGAAKVEVTLDVEDTLIAWQKTVVKIKQHIFIKRKQNDSYRALKGDLDIMRY